MYSQCQEQQEAGAEFVVITAASEAVSQPIAEAAGFERVVADSVVNTGGRTTSP